jgi:hypothetical protein
MPRRSSIDALVDDVLRELEEELESEVGGGVPPKTSKQVFSFRWWVYQKAGFGSGWDLLNDLSVPEEKRTQDDALAAHAAVVMRSYKALQGGPGTDLKVVREINAGHGWMRDGCSTADLRKPLRIEDCTVFDR